ncbi:MAG: hypothetical protein ACRCZ9_11330 [Fusobacteriaceae bacterium]
MKLNLTKKGVFKKTKNTNSKNDICRTWDDFFEEYNIEKSKQSKFKYNNSKKIKQHTYCTTTSDKKYTVIIASNLLTNDKFISDLQMNAWLDTELDVESSRTTNDKVKKITNGKKIYKKLNIEIEKIVKYWFEGEVICVNGDYLDLSTGEFVLSKEFVFSVANDSNFITKLKVLDNESKETVIEKEMPESKIWLLALQIAIKIKEKKENCFVKIKQNCLSRLMKVIKIKNTKTVKVVNVKNDDFFEDFKGAMCYNEKKHKKFINIKLPFT